MAAGDRQFSCFGLLHLISAKLEVNVHREPTEGPSFRFMGLTSSSCSTSQCRTSFSPRRRSLRTSHQSPPALERVRRSVCRSTQVLRADADRLSILSVPVLMVHGTAGCIKALAGQTINLSPETVLDDEGFVEAVDSFDDQPVPLRESVQHARPARPKLTTINPLSFLFFFLSSRLVQLVQDVRTVVDGLARGCR